MDLFHLLPSFWTIFFLSFLITLGTTLIYKYTTDQKRMRQLKEESKKFQEKLRAARNEPEKMMKIQSQAMKVNLELMKHSLKPTLYTFIPIIIIFWLLSSSIAYQNIAPQEEFTITAVFAEGITGNATLSFVPGVTLLSNATQQVQDGRAAWNVKADAGTYKAALSFAGASVEKQFLISSENEYLPPVQTFKGPVEKIVIGNKPTRPFGESFAIFGWHPGWLATYIILSILFSLGLRKLLNVV